MQYVFLLIGATFFLLNLSELKFMDKLISASLVVLSIINFSRLLESKKHGVFIEIMRVLLISLVLILYFKINTASFIISIFVLALFSYLWLFKIKYSKKTY